MELLEGRRAGAKFKIAKFEQGSQVAMLQGYKVLASNVFPYAVHSTILFTYIHDGYRSKKILRYLPTLLIRVSPLELEHPPFIILVKEDPRGHTIFRDTVHISFFISLHFLSTFSALTNVCNFSLPP